MTSKTACAKCGEKLREGASFCQACGAPVDQPSSSPERQLETGKKEKGAKRLIPLALVGVGAAVLITVVVMVMGSDHREKTSSPKAPPTQPAAQKKTPQGNLGWKADAPAQAEKTLKPPQPETTLGWRPDTPASAPGAGKKEEPTQMTRTVPQVVHPEGAKSLGWKPDAQPSETQASMVEQPGPQSGWRPDTIASATGGEKKREPSQIAKAVPQVAHSESTRTLGWNPLTLCPPNQKTGRPNGLKHN